MIRGAVSARLEAVVRLRVRGPGGVEADVDAVLDTGFTSSLTLPPPVVAALGLARQSGGSALLADGSVQPFDTYAAEVDWGGTWRPVLVWVVGNEVPLGMGLLANWPRRGWNSSANRPRERITAYSATLETGALTGEREVRDE